MPMAVGPMMMTVTLAITTEWLFPRVLLGVMIKENMWQTTAAPSFRSLATILILRLYAAFGTDFT